MRRKAILVHWYIVSDFASCQAIRCSLMNLSEILKLANTMRWGTLTLHFSILLLNSAMHIAVWCHRSTWLSSLILMHQELNIFACETRKNDSVFEITYSIEVPWKYIKSWYIIINDHLKILVSSKLPHPLCSRCKYTAVCGKVNYVA